jgi:trehalose utilization protein
MRNLQITVWNEYRHEKRNEHIGKLYPDGMHNAIAAYLKEQPGVAVRTATLDEPEHGLTDEVLANTDTLIWWAHTAHREVEDEIVNRVHARVLDGMGLIVLHSAHYSKIFTKLMGTSCSLKWREAGEKQRVWVIEHGHPIADGLGEYFEIEHAEMYGEPFDIPEPDTLVFISWFPGGEVFRSGCCYYRGRGRVFYFQPGHETYPIYYDPNVLRVIANAARWAAPGNGPKPVFGHSQPLEELP